jgi:hypothetical protein
MALNGPSKPQTVFRRETMLRGSFVVVTEQFGPSIAWRPPAVERKRSRSSKSPPKNRNQSDSRTPGRH